MPEIYRLGEGFVADDWQRLDDEAALPPSGRVIVSLPRWQDESLPAERTGVLLDNTVDIEELDPAVLALPLIALQFPAFTDGRAFSQARLLRERRGYAGELRATGDVHSDQMLYMARCGFDAFEPATPVSAQRIEQALAEFSIAYQPTASGPALYTTG